MTHIENKARRDFRVVFGLALLVPMITVFAWACGGEDDAAGTSGEARTTVVAEGTKFSPASITIQSGKEVTLELQNKDAIEHDFQVDDLEIDVIAGGTGNTEHGADRHGEGTLAMHTAGHESMSITFIVNEPGTYDFYCTIPGHKDSGMVGTLTIQ